MTTKANRQPLPAAEWAEYFREADLLSDRLNNAKSEKGKSTIIGNFLGRLVGRQVPVEVRGRTGKATLRVKPGRAKRNLYYFEVSWDDADPQADGRAGNAKPTDDHPGREPANTSKSRKQSAGKVAAPTSKDERKGGERPTATRLESHSAGGRGNKEQW